MAKTNEQIAEEPRKSGDVAKAAKMTTPPKPKQPQ